MKLIMTLLVRNEEDILKENIEYHLNRGVDLIIAMDNLSEDKTTDILKKYENLGVLKYLYQKDDNYAQDVWCTDMAKMALDLGADWVFHNDADEFWWGDIKTVLNSVPREFITAAATRWDFIPVKSEASWRDSLIYRDIKTENIFGRRILPKVAHRAIKGIKLKTGNHKALLSGGVLLPFETQLEILHFPIRSYAQFEKKVSVGGAAYDRNTTNWRTTPILEYYKLYKDGQLKKYYESLLENSYTTKDTRLKSYLDNLLK